MTERLLPWAEGLSLPLAFTTKRSAFLGMPESGKTYAAMRAAELLYDAGAQFVVLDPVGKWYGLRLGKDGSKAGGLPIPVFGGLHGDLPLLPDNGPKVADLVVDRGLSIVLDVSQFEADTHKARFAHQFMDRFYFRKTAAPSAVLVILEECQEFVPQNPGRGEELMVHSFVKAGKLGRNHGLGFLYITQRPQEVNKKALNLCELLAAFQTTGLHERKAIQEWIRDKDLDLDVKDLLPKLERGAPHVWSPGWLKVSKVARVTVRRTADVSATPVVGAGAVKAQALAPVDIERLKVDMAAAVEKAKAEDPKALRLRVTQLERELAQEPKPAPAPRAPAIDTRPLERQVASYRAALEAAVKFIIEVNAQDFTKAVGEGVDPAKLQAAIEVAVQRSLAVLEEHLAGRRREFLQYRRQGEQLLARLQKVLGEQVHTVAVSVKHNEPFTMQPVQPVSRPRPQPRPARVADDGSTLSKAQQAILNAGAFLESLGIATPDVVQLALFAGQSATGGYWRANIGRLRSMGLIEGTNLTETGRARAEAPDISTVDQMHAHVFTNLVKGAEKQILRVLIDNYPQPLEAEEVGRRAELEPNGGYWRACLGRLRSLGLVAKKTPLVALPVLFLENGR